MFQPERTGFPAMGLNQADAPKALSENNMISDGL
jgi:hypothetical protein